MGHRDIMLVHRAATFFFSFRLPTCHKQQLLPYDTSEVWSAAGSFLNHDVTNGKRIEVDRPSAVADGQ